MGVLRINNLSKAFGIEELFNSVTFDVYKGDRIGFIGANGSGKSTLMKCILHKEEFDSGNVTLDSTDTVGYMEQESSFKYHTLYAELEDAFKDILNLAAKKQELEKRIELAEDETEVAGLMQQYAQITERFEHLGGYDYEARLKKVAFGLGFTEEDFTKDPNLFSGGQRTRLSLAKALIREPDFLFLDEPTNHLDINMLEWLEDFLKNYTGGVLLISHDRFFLDRVCTKILDLENKTTTLYQGNYTQAMELKQQRRAALESAYAKQQEYIRQTQEYIRKYKAGIKSKQARGREKQLQRLERIILPPNKAAFNYFMFHRPEECPQRVLELEDLSFSYPEQDIFHDLNLLIRKGDGVAIVGPNGIGKTTLLKLITGELEPTGGKIKLGSRVQIGYYSQQHEGLDENNTVFQEIANTYALNDEQVRSCLGAFLFKGDDIYKYVGDLSGGEKSRLALLKLMLTGANFLLLDEPTNHLDIPAKEALENAIMAFPGTFIVVSHDRYFLDRIANVTLELEHGQFTEYNGNFSYYRAKKLEMALEQEKLQSSVKTADVKVQTETVPAVSAGQAENKVRKTSYAGYSEDKLNMEISKCEATIAMYEAELKGLEFQMNLPETQADPEQSHKIAQEYSAKEEDITKAYLTWEELTQELTNRN